MTTAEKVSEIDFERAFEEDWCHALKPRHLRRHIRDTWCGELPSNTVGPHKSDGTTGGRCNGCGRRKCPDCLAAMGA
jgi:hypothetical protein